MEAYAASARLRCEPGYIYIYCIYIYCDADDGLGLRLKSNACSSERYENSITAQGNGTTVYKRFFMQLGSGIGLGPLLIC